MRRYQIVPVEHGEIEKLARDLHANGVQAGIFRSGATIAVAIKSGHRIAAATFQFCSENIGRHDPINAGASRSTTAKIDICIRLDRRTVQPLGFCRQQLQPEELMRVFVLVVSVFFLAARIGLTAEPAAPEWSMNASIIEACSCPMFCQCYFNEKPAGHGEHAGHGEGGEHFCKFNNALQSEPRKLWPDQTRRREVLGGGRSRRRFLEGPDGLGGPDLRSCGHAGSSVKESKRLWATFIP